MARAALAKHGLSEVKAMQVTKGKVAEGLCVEGAMPVSEAGGSLFGAR